MPDHELLHPIGHGAYGEVWLAVNVMGAGRAVKIVRRESFTDERPFDREFAALKKYEPLSRAADGLVNVLHAGLAANGDVFFYVMELADAESGDEFDISRAAEYRPRTLRSALDQAGGRLPLAECLSCAQSLVQAVASLHASGLTHRDIKPSNIIFVHHRPKLADIGLVGAVGEARSFVGTEGYIPPEGPGQPGADLYALGMVCYVMASGRKPSEFPQVPPDWLETGGETAMEFMEIILRATEASTERRYRVAMEMLADLALVQSGGSVRRMRTLERRWKWVKRMATLAAAAVIVAGGALWFWQYEKVRETRMKAAETLTVQALAGEREQRFFALRERAAATLRSPMAGARVETLRLIDEAATLHPDDPVLRDLLVTTLTRADFTPVRTWSHDDPFMSPAVSPDGRLIALIEKGGSIRIEATSSGQVARRLPAWEGTRPWSRWRFTPDGAYLGVDYGKASMPGAARFRWWKLSDGTVAWEGAPGAVSLGGVMARGHVITGYEPASSSLIRYDLDARREMDRRVLEGAGSDFVLSPDGTRAAFFAGGKDFVSGLAFVNTAEARVIRRDSTKFMNRAVAWLPDSRHVALGGSNAPFGAFIVSSDDGGEPVRAVHVHAAPVVDVAISADGQFLLTGSWDQTTRISHLSDGEPLALAAGWGGTGSAGFSTDGRHFWRALVREAGTSPNLSFCVFHAPVVSAITSAIDVRNIEKSCFSPDGSLLVTAGDGLTIYCLNKGLENRRLLERKQVQSCVFIRDGSGPALLCGCSTGLFRLRPSSEDISGPWQLERQLADGDFDEVVASNDGRTAIAYGFNTGSLTVRNGIVLPWPSTFGVTSATMSEDGSVSAFAASGMRQVTVQNTLGMTRSEITVPEKTWVSLSPDGSRLFLNETEWLSCLNVADSGECWKVRKDFPNIRGTPVSVDGGRLLLARMGLQFALLDAATGAARCRLEPVFPFAGKNAAVSRDTTRLAMSSNNCLLLWDLATLRAELRRRGMDW
ncbi:MAG TPA: protein kinase family protein [Verrucomicrobiales bacterium]|nr:protein kinase family protein [Verrucomicrobiales bacterium]